MPDYPGCPGKEAVKRVFVFLHFCLWEIFLYVEYILEASFNPKLLGFTGRVVRQLPQFLGCFLAHVVDTTRNALVSYARSVVVHSWLTNECAAAALGDSLISGA